MRHLDRVSMPELVRSESAPNTSRRGGVLELLASG